MIWQLSSWNYWSQMPWRVCRNFTCKFIQNLSTVLLHRMHLHRLFGPFTHSFTRTFLVSIYSDQNGYFQWVSVSDNWKLSFLASCEDRNSFSFSNHVFEKIQDNGQCSNYSYFDVLLIVHFSIFFSVINQLDAQHFCFTISLFHASTCFEHMCSSSGGQNCITQPLVITLKQVSDLKLLKYNSINMSK